MAKTRQKTLMIDILESAPSIAFLIFLRSQFGLEMAGWIGCIAALLVFVALYLLNQKPHPILLGVNLHLLFITPAIVGIGYFGAGQFASFLADHAHKGVLLTVLFVGVVQTMFLKGGFVGRVDLPEKIQTRYSFYLLVAGLVGLFWAFGTEKGAFVGVLLPLTAMIGLRNFLLARWQDNNSGAGAIYVGISADNQGTELAA
ncbi:MAG: hypothetical protein AAGF25_00180 [Pseudomonadota bacterium]